MVKVIRRFFVQAMLVLGLAATLPVNAGDPTRPYGWQPELATGMSERAQDELVLTQIIAFGHHRYAIINGHRYQLSDQIGDFRIVAIENQRVRLQNGQQEIELRMFAESVKRRINQQGEIE